MGGVIWLMGDFGLAQGGSIFEKFLVELMGQVVYCMELVVL